VELSVGFHQGISPGFHHGFNHHLMGCEATKSSDLTWAFFSNLQDFTTI
jgi:hypothetical protein